MVTGLILVMLFAFLFPWLFNSTTMPIWPWLIASMLWLPALFYPCVLQPVYTSWMKVGHVLGWINTRIILGLLFYLIVLPMGLIMRLFGFDPMARKKDQESSSYRVKSISEPKDRLEKPY